MEWFEELPDKCPPSNALIPNNEIFYRLTNSFPPTDEDFSSHKKIWPTKQFNVDDCRARSVSLLKKVDSLKNLIQLPRHASKIIVSIILDNKSGVILKTGQDQNHYSWWRSSNFNLINSTKKTSL